VTLTGEADRFEHTLLYEEIAEHRPVFALLLKDRDKGYLIRAPRRMSLSETFWAWMPGFDDPAGGSVVAMKRLLAF
jgi:hypothetical protein